MKKKMLSWKGEAEAATQRQARGTVQRTQKGRPGKEQEAEQTLARARAGQALTHALLSCQILL